MTTATSRNPAMRPGEQAESRAAEGDRAADETNHPGRLITLVGPTGSGKSDIAMAAAEATGAHIVAIDAFTIYRGMDIGTAKPTREDQARVPHHCLDLLDPAEDGTVAWFQGICRQVINCLLDAGEKVLCVGGSGLYARAVLDVMHFPPTDPHVRARIAAAVNPNPREAHAQLAAIDPEAAAKIEPDNARRITRALEVIELTGKPFSSFATDWEGYQTVFPGLQLFGLHRDREDLRNRIAQRTHKMLAEGWIEECTRLLDANLSATAAQAHGYKEIMAAIRGEWTMAEAQTQTINRTRQYAARQQRWFAKDPRIVWGCGEALTNQLIAALTQG